MGSIRTVCLFVLGAVFTAACASTGGRVGASRCGPAGDDTDFVMPGLKALVVSAEPKAVAYRERIHLPTVSDTAVQVVTDDAVCRRALATLNRARGGHAAVSLAYVIRVGTRYVVFHPSITAGEFTQRFVLDDAFRLLTIYLN